MTPEIGQLCLILALCVAAIQSVLPVAGAQFGNPAWIAVARPAAVTQLLFIALAFICLSWAFVENDFSVLYVATNSNSELPLMFRLAAVWGAHEGSLLLWVLILAIWTSAVALLSRTLPDVVVAQVLGVMGMINLGFLLFILFTSNPFERLFPVPLDGNDLNPLLQDPALIIHPPMLYTGYVGFSVAFAFAVAAMLSGRLDQQWARWARPWTTTAWLFLTVGIALGSWWAYYELGWGGWWFWDPVENASFMPWLAGTALIHSLAVTEKRGLFKSSTLLLAIGTFSLSLLGTFLVRSGVLVSVHAFASDPARGLFILIFLAVVVGGALSLYAWRARSLETSVGFSPVSRETFLLLNSILLVAATGLILFGTLAPLIAEAMNLGKISVGAPYFEFVFPIVMVPLLLVLGVGMHSVWRSTDASLLARRLRWPAAIAVLVGISLPWFAWGEAGLLTVIGSIIGLTTGAWVIGSVLLNPIARLRGKGPRLTRSMIGMHLAHLGIGMTVIGITVTSSFNIEIDQRIAPGETVTVGGYAFRFDGLEEIAGANYEAVRGTFTVSRGDREIAKMIPEKRVYRVQTSAMTEAGIDVGWTRDLFVALGEPLGDGSWSVRIQYKPMIRFIWLGALVMALGGLVAVSDRRYRSRYPVADKSPDQPTDLATA
ncbi:MAG: heme lyase CcmF/NrfE family subunit [Gammaproteobacteria bacterium]|nr:heme lyase CcmF/NrfE family subunit [Gammaproteobacteria bacterium]